MAYGQRRRSLQKSYYSPGGNRFGPMAPLPSFSRTQPVTPMRTAIPPRRRGMTPVPYDQRPPSPAVPHISPWQRPLPGPDAVGMSPQTPWQRPGWQGNAPYPAPGLGQPQPGGPRMPWWNPQWQNPELAPWRPQQPSPYAQQIQRLWPGLGMNMQPRIPRRNTYRGTPTAGNWTTQQASRPNYLAPRRPGSQWRF